MTKYIVNGFFLITGVSIALYCMLISCKAESNESTQYDDYYVKYKFESKYVAPYSGGTDIIRLRLDDNSVTNDTVSTGNHEFIIGPVQKGFKAFMSLRNNTTRDKILKVNIPCNKDS